MTAEIIAIKAIYASTLPSLEESIKSFKNNQSDKLEPEKKNFKILKSSLASTLSLANLILKSNLKCSWIKRNTKRIKSRKRIA